MLSRQNSSLNLNALNQPAWTYHPLNKFDSASSHLFVLVGHHLVVFPQRYYNDKGYEDSYVNPEEKMRMIVVDLGDFQIQRIEIPEAMICHPDFECTLIRESDNQIIKVEGDPENVLYVWRMTFESFNPLSVKSEYIMSRNGPGPALCKISTEIYEDRIYVYGEKERCVEEHELWYFNLGPRGRPSSFIFEDTFYVYGGTEKKNHQINTKEIFAVNLLKLTWMKLKQEDEIIKCDEVNLTGQIYKDHLILLAENTQNKETLCCWDIKNNTWRNVEVETIGFNSSRYGRLFVYKDLLLTFGIHGGLSVAMLNLKSLGLAIPESSETQYLRSIFLDEKDSDIMFLVENQVLPAHRKVLRERSKYYENLFRSWTADSIQKAIFIEDCDYDTFKEYLRFLYCEEIENPDEILAIKLLGYSDKYLQADLHEKCMDFLTYNINSNNVYTILEFARNEKNLTLQSWCMKYLKSNLNPEDVSALIRYLNQQKDSEKQEFAKENLELRDKAINYIIKNYEEIHEKDADFKLYEDFLKDNITIATNGILAKFLYEHDLKGQERLTFQRNTASLKEALYGFAEENFHELKKKHVTNKFPQAYWEDLVNCLVGKIDTLEKKVAKKKEKKEKEKEKEKENDSDDEPKKKKKQKKEKENDPEDEPKKKKKQKKEKENEPDDEPKRKKKRKESSKKNKKEEPEGEPVLKKTKKTQTKKKGNSEEINLIESLQVN